MTGSFRALVTSMRPRQWTKNLVVFAPLLFSGAFTQPRCVVSATFSFALLCVLSSAGYLLNDVRDAVSDRRHPSKRERPVASGALGANAALAVAALLTCGALAASFALGPRAVVVVSGYAALQVAYVLALRRYPVVDVMAIAVGFVARAMLGAAAIGVPDSAWLLTCAGLLALFLALAKRRQEIIVLGPSVAEHRRSLAGASPALFDEMIAAVAGATMVSYAVYAQFIAEAEGYRNMIVTLPLVVFGLLRYLYLVHTSDAGSAPEEVLLTDPPLIADVVLYIAVVALIVSPP